MALHQPTQRETNKPKSKTGGTHSTVSVPSSVSIPDKLYFRIGEVARLCAVPAYVLRFWESEFPQLKPHKGGTGQRLYRKRDVALAMEIKQLLYDQKFTIPGARRALEQMRDQKREESRRSASGSSLSANHSNSDIVPQSELPFLKTELSILGPQFGPQLTPQQKSLAQRLQQLRGEVREILCLLDNPMLDSRPPEGKIAGTLPMRRGTRPSAPQTQADQQIQQIARTPNRDAVAFSDEGHAPLLF